MPAITRSAAMLAIALAGLQSLCISQTVLAQDYPTRPIRLVIPFAAGGTTDSVGRVLAAGLSTRLGQQVIVENKPGAGSQIGLEYVMHAPADGYTIALGGSDGLAVMHAIRRKSPYDSLKDFTPIALVANAALSYTVNAKVPANTLKDFIAYARSKPGAVRYGSAGVGTTLHLGIEQLQAMAGIDMVHVPYKGGAPMMTDVVAGEVELVLTSADFAKRWADTGQLRVLAQADTVRHPLLPNVPTTTEAGMPELQAVTWFGLFGPAGLPRPIVERIAAELPALLADRTLIDRLITVGAYTRFTPAAEIPSIITEDTARWTRIVRDARIPLQD